jgi:hypothetical protein
MSPNPLTSESVRDEHFYMWYSQLDAPRLRLPSAWPAFRDQLPRGGRRPTPAGDRLGPRCLGDHSDARGLRLEQILVRRTQRDGRDFARLARQSAEHQWREITIAF